MLIYQLWTAHSPERIGDHTTNVCERVFERAGDALEEANVSRY